MTLFKTLFNEIFYRPLANALIFLTGFVPGHDVGIAIILLTLLVRLILFPFSHRSLFTQLKMKELEPEIAKNKEETKDRGGGAGTAHDGALPAPLRLPFFGLSHAFGAASDFN